MEHNEGTGTLYTGNVHITHHITPAMFDAMRRSPYDVENGCTAEPSDCTREKARINGNDKPNSGMPSLPLEKLVAPSAEDELETALVIEEEDCMYVPLDVIRQSELLSKQSASRPYQPKATAQVTYPENFAQDDVYAALARGEEPKDLGNAHYGASPKLPEQKSEDVEKALKWKRDDKNAKGKKLRSKDSIIFLL
jgi:hypothetical protein